LIDEGSKLVVFLDVGYRRTILQREAEKTLNASNNT